ncbi:hypothetical protein A4G19_08720 [Pasteurellaceae bacterium Macca]|nr:hypothetical protein [Pasteurellaceae bacterium Macca]
MEKEQLISISSTLSDKERKALQQQIYRELLRVRSLLDDDFREQSVFGMMSALVKKARYQVNGTSDEVRLNQLLDLVYREWGFFCDPKTFFQVENLMIDRVLTRKQGMPVSIGSVLLYLAQALNLPLYPVSFPTQLIIRAELTLENGRNEARFIDPANGRFVSYPDLEKWLEGEFGFGAELKRDMLHIASSEALVERLETVCKMALTSEGRYLDALNLIEYRLQIEPEDPYEIRDRGMILASLECYQAALNDFNYFIDQCPDDPSAVMIKLELAGLEKHAKGLAIH